MPDDAPRRDFSNRGELHDNDTVVNAPRIHQKCGAPGFPLFQGLTPVH
jgi:hypothetical protein